MAKITDFITEAMAKGHSENQIEAMLTSKGWDRITVNRAILDVKFHTEKESYTPQHTRNYFHKIPKRKLIIEIIIIFLLFASIGAFVFPNMVTKEQYIIDDIIPIDESDISIPIIKNLENFSMGDTSVDDFADPVMITPWCTPGSAWNFQKVALTVCGFVAIGESDICQASDNCPIGGYFFTKNNIDIWEILHNGTALKVN